MLSVELTLSIIATTLAVASFGGQAWKIWRDRPRLIFFVGPITFKNVPHFKEKRMVQVMICNVGYRPIVLTRFVAIGERGSFHMGIDDEPAAALGIQDQRFPTLLEPGRTLKIHPIAVEALVRNQTDPADPKVAYDPYRYFVIVDSFGRLHPIDVSDVLWELRVITQRRRTRGFSKLLEGVRRSLFLRAARRRIGR